MATYLAPIGSGLGDVIVALPILQWLVDTSSEPVYLVARSERQLGLTERISGIAGTVREIDLPSVLSVSDRLINLREHPLQRHWDWYEESFERAFGQYLINDILRQICVDFGMFPDFSRSPPLSVLNTIRETADKVLFVPGTTTDRKSWPVSSWVSLQDKFTGAGLQCLMLGQPDRSEVVAQLRSSGVPWYETPTVGNTIDAISSARLVVSVDTGLMHVAVQQGIQTVAMFNKVHTYLRPYGNCHALLAPSCQTVCFVDRLSNGAEFPTTYEWGWWDGEFADCKAEKSKHCLTQIAVQKVFDVAIHALAVTSEVAPGTVTVCAC